jgi:hypothetical protein
MAESHISLLVVRKIVRAISHASSVRAIQEVNRSFFNSPRKRADQRCAADFVLSEWACQF